MVLGAAARVQILSDIEPPPVLDPRGAAIDHMISRPSGRPKAGPAFGAAAVQAPSVASFAANIERLVAMCRPTRAATSTVRYICPRAASR